MVSKKQLSWRRNKTQELLIKGHNQIQIAHILQVSEATISNDVGHLRGQARINIENHLQDRLPEEFERCMSGINQILKMSWEIATRDYQGNFSGNINSKANPDKTFASKMDDKTRLQALALANDCYKYKMELVTNSVVITDAIKFVQQKKEELETINNVKTDSVQEKISGLNSNMHCNQKNKTTNKIF